MTDNEILKRCHEADQVPYYKVDDQAIRRGKANLALMMTLTTADHYDWFVSKFASHNFFDYHGYRVYRRNVTQTPVAISQEEVHKLKALDDRIQELRKKYLYSFSETKEPLRELLSSIQLLTPILLDNLTKLSTKQVHYIGEIYNEDDRLILNKDVDLVYIYTEANGCADIEDALAKIYHDFEIGDGTFDPVPIDDRTHWGMSSCRAEELDVSKYYFDDSSMTRIFFEDHRLVLGEVIADNDKDILTPHTRWRKGLQLRDGADLTIPFAKPYPLWNLPVIQLRKDHIIMLTDNLLLANKEQQSLNQNIQEETQKQFGDHTLSQYYSFENSYSTTLEEHIKHEVEARIEKEWAKKWEWEWKQIKDRLNEKASGVGDFSSHDLIYYAARLLFIYPPKCLDDKDDDIKSHEKRVGYIPYAIKRICDCYRECTDWHELYSKVRDMDNLASQDTKLYDDNREYCNDMYYVLCDTIRDLFQADLKRWNELQYKITCQQKFCWSSWFGGDDALPDVNWRELRKRDVVYVLTDDNKASFITAIKVYLHTKHICKSIRFAVKERLLNAEKLLTQAKGKYGLALEDLRTYKQKASAFENFDPSVAPSQEVNYLLEPIISDKSITLLYAPPGVGKTWFTMCIALAVSRGQALFANDQKSWIATAPHRIAYIDSEMTEFHFKNRLRLLDLIYRKSPSDKPFSFKLVGEESINLLDEDQNQCDKITQWLNDEAAAGNPIDLLILDNLSTLTRFNDSAKAWETVFSWLKMLKNKVKNRCSTIVVHHSNKKGDQRGSSAKTATVDNVIKLEHVEAISPEDIELMVTVEKGRDMKRIPQPFSAVLHLPTKKSAKPSFTIINPNKDEKTRSDEAKAYLTGEKKPSHEVIAALTGLTPAYVRQVSHQLKKKSKEA